MQDNSSKVIFNLLLSQPELIPAASRVLFIRAEDTPGLRELKVRELDCLQTSKTEALRLESAGFHINLTPQKGYDAAIYLPTKQRTETLYGFARAAELVRRGGVVICAMSNKIGAGRFAKEFARLFSSAESISKNHCRAFWGMKDDSLDEALLQEWLALGGLREIDRTGWVSQPGVFAWDRIDRGSELLCRSLPRSLHGRGADLGSGWGFISAYILQNMPQVNGVYLYESEYLGIEAAKHNLAAYSDRAEIEHVWHDVTLGLRHSNLDWIVTNPPFHEGKRMTTSLGEQFIRSAARALRPGGKIFLVCNSGLPYEPSLRAHFSPLSVLAEEGGYTVYVGVR